MSNTRFRSRHTCPYLAQIIMSILHTSHCGLDVLHTYVFSAYTVIFAVPPADASATTADATATANKEVIMICNSASRLIALGRLQEVKETTNLSTPLPPRKRLKQILNLANKPYFNAIRC